MESRRLRGFTLVEVMIAVSIMGIMAAVIAFNVEFTKQSAKHEAEKVVMYIQNLMKKSDRMHTSFDIDVEDKVIVASWGIHGTRKESFDATPGCTYTPDLPHNSKKRLIYDRNNLTNKAKVAITDSKSGYDYYIEIADSSGTVHYVGIETNQD